MEQKVFEGLEYLISYPEEFKEDKKYPLVIFLHGAGTRGSEIERLKNNACVQNLLKRQDARGYILLAPHCKRGGLERMDDDADPFGSKLPRDSVY